jgi:NADH-quinone oxidoreductase subunit G
LGGTELSDQAAYAWGMLAQAIGTSRIDSGFGRDLGPEVHSLPTATIDDICAPGGTVLWIGADPKEELPVLFLRLRDAVRNKGVRLLHVGSPERGSLPALARISAAPRAGELGRALAASIDGVDLDEPTPDLDRLVEELRSCETLTVVIGRRTLSESADCTRQAIAAITRLNATTRFLLADPAPNAGGAHAAGLSGSSLDEIIDGIDQGAITAAIVLNADPVGQGICQGDLRAALSKIKVINLTTLTTSLQDGVEVVLPIADWGETSGSTTNLEGRVLPLAQRVTPVGTSRDAALIAADIADRLGHDLGFDTVDELTDAMAAAVPSRQGMTAAVLRSARGRDGILSLRTDATGAGFAAVDEVPVPKVSGYSYRLVAVKRLYANTPRTRACISSAPLIAATQAWLHPADFATLGVAEGGQVSLVSPRGSCRVVVESDEAVPKGNIHAVIDGAGDALSVLIDPRQPLTEVRIKEGGA